LKHAGADLKARDRLRAVAPAFAVLLDRRVPYFSIDKTTRSGAG
jgi:hypothetical protein